MSNEHIQRWERLTAAEREAMRSEQADEEAEAKAQALREVEAERMLLGLTKAA